MIKKLYIPPRFDIICDKNNELFNITKKWYKNFFLESKYLQPLNNSQLLKFQDQRSNGSAMQLNFFRRKFFYHHYVRTTAIAISYLFRKRKKYYFN